MKKRRIMADHLTPKVDVKQVVKVVQVQHLALSTPIRPLDARDAAIGTNLASMLCVQLGFQGGTLAMGYQDGTAMLQADDVKRLALAAQFQKQRADKAEAVLKNIGLLVEGKSLPCPREHRDKEEIDGEFIG